MRSDARKRAEAFLVQCGPCDGGLPMGCACNPDDPRPVFAALLDRLESAERKVARVEALADEWDDEALQAWRDADRLHCGAVIADQISRRAERLRAALDGA